VKSLGGFPGAEAAFFARTAGVPNLLPMMNGETDREAYFKTAIAVYMPDENRIETFTGKMTGKIPESKRRLSPASSIQQLLYIPDHGMENLLLKTKN